MSTITELPLVVVCGATGSQGSSIAQYLLRDGGYKVRIITRNPNGEKAQALKQQGAEVFHCDIENKERVTLALDGAYAVFGLTNFWEHGAEAEIRQGKNLADAAKTCGVKHFLWSSCPHVDSGAPRHWESKVEVENYLHELGVPTTAIFPAFYFQNIWMFFPLKKLPDGSPVLDWFFPSEVPIPSFSVEDLGAWFMIALKDPGTWIGKQMKLTSEILTPREYAVRLSNGMGMKVASKEVSLAEFEALQPHVPSDVWINISEKAFWDNPNLMQEAVGSSRQLFPGWQSLEDFAKKYKDKLLAAAVPA